MPTKKTSSAVKKTAGTKKKKTTAAKPVKKSRSVSAKKKPAVKKKATRKAPAKKTAKKKSTSRKKSEIKPAEKPLVLETEMVDDQDRIHVFTERRTLINQLPVVDLDTLAQNTEPEQPKPEPEEEHQVIAVRSRLAFYLGVFMGAVVLNAFLVTILAVISN